MTGKHITQDQIAVYRATRQDHTLVHSARIAAISRSSASRIDNGAWDRRKPATRRDRHTKLSGVWDNAGLPYLVEHPKASAKDVHQYLQRICPGLVSPSQRRTIERRCKARKIEHLRNAKDDSVAFFHSAHQGCIDLSSLSERAKTSPDLRHSFAMRSLRP
jgi:hypothetical protein